LHGCCRYPNIGIQEPQIGEKISARGKLLFLAACEIAAVRTNKLQAANTQANNAAIREIVQIAQDVLNECFERDRYLYE
jgi:hypothetical protein